MSLISATQFLRQRDRRRVAELLSDDGTPVPDASLAANANLAALLIEASGAVLSAARVGQRYSAATLSGIGADDNSATGGLLRRIVGDIAYSYLIARRGFTEQDRDELASLKREAMIWLEQLRLGERIFDMEGAPDAGLPDVVVFGGNQNQNSNSITSAGRLWGAMNTGGTGYGN